MGGKQLRFGDYEQTKARTRTKSERLLSQMEAGYALEGVDQSD
jgi:hypothetical protein